MKKIPLLLAIIALTLTACKKENTVTDTNAVPDTAMTETLPADSAMTENFSSEEMTADSYTYDYIAEDGSIAKVTFKNTDTEHTMTVNMGDKTYVLKQTEAWAKGADYKGDNASAHSQQDNLELTVDGKTVKMKRQYDR